jgi:hypothetical protein
MSIKGKSVIVTGGASGIGRATVAAFCAAGAKVCFGDINEEAGAAAASEVGDAAAFHRLDVTDDASIAAFAAWAQGRGDVDAVVNVAGWDIIQPFLENTPDFWDKIIAINLMGQVKITRAFLDGMVERNSGKIVNVASDAGRVGSMGETVYAGAKGGVIGAHARGADPRHPLPPPRQAGGTGGRHPVLRRQRLRLHHRTGSERQRRPHDGRLTGRRSWSLTGNECLCNKRVRRVSATHYRHSRESGDPVDASVFWIPACAGMTVEITRPTCEALA